MDSFDIYILEDIEKAMSQRDKKLAANASTRVPRSDSIYNNELLRVAGICALGVLCLKRKSLSLPVSSAMLTQGALVGSVFSGLCFAAFKSSSRLAVKPRVVW